MVRGGRESINNRAVVKSRLSHKNRVTVAMVAERAGVSAASVSYVVNGSRSVSEKMKTRVQAAIDELGFSPNLMARGLRKRRSYGLCLIMANIANPFYSELARCIEDIAFRRGYTIVFCNSDDNPEKERAYIRSQIGRRVDGIILAPSSNTRDFASDLIEQDTPCVLINRTLPDFRTLGFPSFTIDNVNAARLATQHLIDHGHERIAAITGATDTSTTSGRRVGYEQAMVAAGLAVGPSLVRSGASTAEGARLALEDLLRSPSPPTAVVVMGTTMTLGALRALGRAGVRCPEDVALISFSETDWSEVAFAPLTTVRQPIEAIATQSVEHLISLVEGSIPQGEFWKEVVFESELVVRRSCGCSSTAHE